MSLPVVITGSGVLSPLADTLEGLHGALCDGASGIKPVELFSTDGLRVRRGGEIADFRPVDYLGRGNFRPLDRTAQLVSSAAQRALDGSGWNREAVAASGEVGLVLGTLFGSVRTIAEFDRRALEAGPQYAKPMDFANSVINAAAGQAAIWHGLGGINSTLSSGSPSGLQALGYAAALVAQGRSPALLAGGGEELCFESFFGFYKAGLLAGSTNGAGERPHPFDARRNGFALAAGAALLVLEPEAAARARGAAVLGRVLASANTFDPSRGRDAGQAQTALATAIRQALAAAAVTPGEILAVSSGASGSIEGDRREAAALAEALGEHAATVPVTAVKSMLGEALGAGGALQTLALLAALRSGRLPGVRGFEGAEAGFPLGGVTAATTDLTSTGHHRAVGLVTALGRDGHAAALVIEGLPAVGRDAP
jgi:3-oxoacyl-[acyl-carrier-protein] synthase II